MKVSIHKTLLLLAGVFLAFVGVPVAVEGQQPEFEDVSRYIKYEYSTTVSTSWQVTSCIVNCTPSILYHVAYSDDFWEISAPEVEKFDFYEMSADCIDSQLHRTLIVKHETYMELQYPDKRIIAVPPLCQG